MKLAYAPIDQQHPHRVAAVYGPVALVREQERVVPDVNNVSKWIGSKGEGLEFRA